MSPIARPSSARLLLVSAILALPALLLATGCGHTVPGASGSPSASASARASGSPLSSASADTVVATVDGSPVRTGDVEVVHAERRLLGQDDDPASALKEAIERKLMRREAERLHLTPSASQVRDRMSEIESSFGGADALDAALRGARSSREQLERSVSDGVLREALRDAKFGSVRATAAQVGDYYRRNRRRLFTTPASVHLGAIEVRTRMVAENGIKRLRQGRPFAEVARQLSIDPQSKEAGGDLGWVLTSSLPTAAREGVKKSGTGLVERPIQGNGVWYVFKVFARRPERVSPFSAVRGRILTELTDVARSKALQDWLAAARKRATITMP